MEEFRDTFMDRVKDLVRWKLAGDEIEIGEFPQPLEEVSLLDALKASVGVEEPAAATAKAPAAPEEVVAPVSGELTQEYSPLRISLGKVTG